MSIEKIKSILKDHGVPYYMSAGRVYADSMISTTDTFEQVKDITDWTYTALISWIGY